MPPRGQGKGQAVGRNDVSGASGLAALRRGDVTQSHLAGFWDDWVVALGCLWTRTDGVVSDPEQKPQMPDFVSPELEEQCRVGLDLRPLWSLV